MERILKTELAQQLYAQKEQTGGKKTMKSYLWMLELQSYDEQHS